MHSSHRPERVHHSIVSKDVEHNILMDGSSFVDHGCVFAFVGGAALGNATDSFKLLDTAMPLQVVSLLPMERTIKDSHISMPSMCVSDLGIRLVDSSTSISNCIYLGWSLGSSVA